MSARILWATDVHLDAAEMEAVESFCVRVNEQSPQCLLLGGDIAEGPSLPEWLSFLADRIDAPIYYVLGNHDYYGSSIDDVRIRVREMNDPRLHWLPHIGVVDLGQGMALVGQDGWGDARLGDFFGSYAVLNDYLAIKDLSVAFDLDHFDGDLREQGRLKDLLGRLGDDEAAMLRPSLQAAAVRNRQVLVLTHVPPFREACWYRGGLSDDNWLPGFSCKAMGDLLLETAETHPQCTLTVLCGHTHGTGVVDILPNLRVHTGEAQYGRVDFRIVDLDSEADVVLSSPG